VNFKVAFLLKITNTKPRSSIKISGNNAMIQTLELNRFICSQDNSYVVSLSYNWTKETSTGTISGVCYM